MSLPTVKLKLLNPASLKLELVARYPARIEADDGIKVTLSGGVATISPDVGSLTEVTELAGGTDWQFWAYSATLGYARFAAQALVDYLSTGYQPLDATLTALAGVTTAADEVIYATGPDAFATAPFTSYGRSLVATADEAAFKLLTNLRIGVDVQAYSANLDDWSGKATPTGDVVGTTDVQTLTNKTLTAPAISDPTGIVAADIGGLAAVATTGEYGDLSGTPTLGTAAAADASDFATAAQGALADTAVQPGDLGALATKNQVDIADIDATGTPSSSTYLRGDGAWATPEGGGGGGDTDFLTLSLMAIDLADGAGGWKSYGNIFADSFDTTEMVDTAGATNLDTSTPGQLSPELSPGADLTSSAFAIRSGVFSADPAHQAGNAFDGNPLTYWIGAEVGSAVNGVSWIGQDFGAGNAKTIRTVTILQNFGANANQSVTSVVIQFSDDGSIWSGAGVGNPFALGAYNVLQTLNINDVGAHRYWRVLANSGIPSPSVGWAVGEIQMMEATAADIDVRSEVIPSPAQPASMKVVAVVEPVDPITLNTDLIFSVSRDNGTTWSAAAMSLAFTAAGDSYLESDWVDVSAQPAANQPAWRLQSDNNKDFVLHGLAVCLQ